MTTIKPVIDWLPYIKENKARGTRLLLALAYQQAADRSKDPNTQTGAIIMNPAGMIIGTGTNHFPKGVTMETSRLVRPLKYVYMEHAERNAIFDACRLGKPTDGSTMYAPWYACCDCARGIIQSGIIKVIGHKQCFDRTPDRWRENIIHAVTMLEEAGVVCEVYTKDIGGSEIIFDDTKWNP